MSVIDVVAGPRGQGARVGDPLRTTAARLAVGGGRWPGIGMLRLLLVGLTLAALAVLHGLLPSHDEQALRALTGTVASTTMSTGAGESAPRVETPAEVASVTGELAAARAVVR